MDLFFRYHPFHDELAREAHHVPFADTSIPVIAGEHLAVCKAMFDRPKNWFDIDSIARSGKVDFDKVIRWLQELLGADAPQVIRLQTVARRYPRVIEGAVGSPLVTEVPAPDRAADE